MPSADMDDGAAVCSRCRSHMEHVAVTPHPVVPLMQRTTFVYRVCNRTQTYMLAVMLTEVAQVQ